MPREVTEKVAHRFIKRFNSKHYDCRIELLWTYKHHPLYGHMIQVPMCKALTINGYVKARLSDVDVRANINGIRV